MKKPILHTFYILTLVLCVEGSNASIYKLLRENQISPATSYRNSKMHKPNTYKLCVKDGIICIPSNYSKFDLPDQDNVTKVTFQI